MSVKLISYDLNREVVRPPLLKTIKETYPNWAKISESSYAVDTVASAQQIFDRLRPLIDSNKSMTMVGASAGRLI